MLTDSGDCVFTINHAELLAKAILQVNWKYLDTLEKTAKDDEVERGYVSMRMIEIQKRWNQEIADTCRSMMAGMSETVNAFRRIAADAVNAMPPKIVITRECGESDIEQERRTR